VIAGILVDSDPWQYGLEWLRSSHAQAVFRSSVEQFLNKRRAADVVSREFESNLITEIDVFLTVSWKIGCLP
jgi:hypothetical protein